MSKELKLASENYHVARTALLDADYLAYHTAAWAHTHQADSMEMHEKMSNALDLWVSAACASEAVMLFSCDREENYRKDHYPLYKSHRTGEAPAMLGQAKETLASIGFRTATRPRVEADDLIGILMTNGKVVNPVCVSRDKDLRQIPGWHLNPFTDDFPVYVTRDAADYLFYQQWLTGDSTDGFGGIKGMGPKKAQKLLDAGLPHTWLKIAVRAYQKAGMTKDEAEAQARCARILRVEDWDAKEQAPIPWSVPEGLWEDVASES